MNYYENTISCKCRNKRELKPKKTLKECHTRGLKIHLKFDKKKKKRKSQQQHYAKAFNKTTLFATVCVVPGGFFTALSKNICLI